MARDPCGLKRVKTREEHSLFRTVPENSAGTVTTISAELESNKQKKSARARAFWP
jgi:hypothetical protein